MAALQAFNNWPLHSIASPLCRRAVAASLRCGQPGRAARNTEGDTQPGTGCKAATANEGSNHMITFNDVEPYEARIRIINVRFWRNKTEVSNWNIRDEKIVADRVQLEGQLDTADEQRRFASLFVDAEVFNGLRAGKYDVIIIDGVVVGETDDVAGKHSTYRKCRLDPNDYVIQVKPNGNGLKRPFPVVVPAEDEEVDG